MRALITTGGAPSIQRMLGRVARGGIASGQDPNLKHAMEVLVPAVDLRVGGAVVAQTHTGAGEPDAQARKLSWLSETIPRCAAIGVDAQRQPIAFEGLTQVMLYDRALRLRAGRQHQVGAGVVVDRDQRQTALVVSQHEPTLEIYLPELIRFNVFRALSGHGGIRGFGCSQLIPM